MPSYSIGFWVAATRNGSGSGRARPSTETWRSSMTSSSDACVFGGVRLISSASSRLVKTGPSRNSNSAVRASKISDPVTSPGIRSGVNCTRLVSRSSAAATVRTSSVFATPGTPSSSTCPRASRAITMPDTTASWPTTTLPTSARSRPRAARACCGSPTGSGAGWASGIAVSVTVGLLLRSRVVRW